ncbi:type IV pilus modification protein PilV [Guyparkeria hydrothermalis]|uniref:type IV pilus modification protein PilV n=1 Tax=Guyparkeria hydrothermalis TaxID=923 RepID=UPI0020209937|nr:type IV pilus modification protein PilV [Guyparkeria hydrothermalis]MCL7751029.1 type IV pilus modification protein PilV [Guyparkeria hydrothermalis]
MIRRTPAIPDVPGRQSGVGLIEILIAVLVLSVGFLGMAALQSKALSNNNSAMARSMGTIASYSILDAMRIDPAGVDAGSYDGVEIEVPADGDCAGVDGGAADLAGVNLESWCGELAELVGPGTTGTITSLGGGNYRITIEFDDSRATGGEDAETLVTQAKL